MLIMKRGPFLLIIIIAILCIMAVGSWGFITFHPGDTADAAALKFFRESLFYGAVCASILLVVLASGIVLRSRFLRRDIENLLGRRRWDETSQQQFNEVLGDLGESIYRMNAELIKTSEGRGFRIQGLRRLVDFIVNNAEIPVAVSDVFGEFVYTSDLFLEKLSVTRTDLLGTDVSRTLQDVSMTKLIPELRKTRSHKDYTGGGRDFAVYPIFDDRGEIVYLVFSLGKTTFRYNHPAKQSDKKDGGKGKQNWLKDRFGKAFGRK